MTSAAIKSSKISSNRHRVLASLWDSIGRIRFLLAFLVFLYSFLDPHIKSRAVLWLLISVYIGINFFLRLFYSSILYLKRIRVIPALVDIVFISLVAHNSTGTGNSWFLFYLFPIISASKYLGYFGTLSIAVFSIASYLFVYIGFGQGLDVEARWFALRSCVFVGVAIVAASLARTRQRELIRLSQVHKEIDQAIRSDLKLDQILGLILKKGLEFTNSEMGHIRLINSEAGEQENHPVTVKYPPNHEWATRPFDEELSTMAVQQRTPLIVPQIQQWHLRRHLAQYFSLCRPRPKSALFVPLEIDGRVIGIIAVYSRWDYHYKKMDARRLTTFTPLVEMALKTVESRELQNYYRNLIVNSPDPIIVLDRDGKIKVFNRACEQLWGFRYEEVRDHLVTNYYVSSDHAKEIGRLLRVSEDNRVENYEALIKAKNGETIPISLSACWVKDTKRNRVGSIGVFKDRRIAIQAEEKLLQAERLAMVGRLAGTVGHDIKHNIATALNYLDGLLYKCDPVQEPRLYRVYNSIKSVLQQSVDEFNDLLLAHLPKLPNRVDVSISEIFRAAEDKMRRQALDKDIDLIVTYPDPDLVVSVDFNQLGRVLSNLFTNSVHAITLKQEGESAFEKGRIELLAESTRNEARIIWKDNGVGIPEHIRENIFNAFVTSKGSKGTGLGLFIVKTIIENHNGCIHFNSKMLEGTTFHIDFPVVNGKSRIDFS